MSGAFLGNARSVSVIQATLDPANIATATTTEQTFTVTTLNVGDAVFVSKPSVTAGIAVNSARVSAQDTLAITFTTTTTNINAPSEVYTIVVIRPEVSGATSVVS